MRIKRLDILRCVAILLVIGHHPDLFPVLTKVGWVGVDLFFVLSGFLISGLLYTEYKKRGDIDFQRFFIRRGLKIYPAFYAMLLASLAVQLLFWKGPVPLWPYLREFTFVQNYRFAIWTHTWSLAVEEHFYIILGLFLLVLARFSSHRSDPFRIIPSTFVAVAITCLLLRIFTIVFTRPSAFLTSSVMNVTHTRMDGLFFGVFLGYLYHFRPETMVKLFQPLHNQIVIGLLTAGLLSCCYFFGRDSHFLLTFGLSFLYLGFGGLLLLALQIRGVVSGAAATVLERIGTVFAFVGTYSYSIYLWHAPWIAATGVFRRRVLHFEIPGVALFAFYLIGSIALGIVFARLIEFPALRLRDRLIPAISKAPAIPASPSPGKESASAVSP